MTDIEKMYLLVEGNWDPIEKSIRDSSDVFHRGHEIVKVPISENKYLPPQYDIYLSKFLG